MPIQFIKSPDSSEGEADLLQLLTSELSKNKKLLWIVSGGSNTAIIVRVMSNLKDSLTKNLQLTLSDERYGIEGHKDSNYQQLVDAGLDIKQATFDPVLTGDLGLEETVTRYSDSVDSAISSADLIIGQLGIGEDGHIAGVLPMSPVVNSTDQIVHYEAGPYDRVSMSLKALKSINTEFTFCFGDNKRQALTRLKDGQESLDQLPSLILNSISDVKVYNDQIEGTK